VLVEVTSVMSRVMLPEGVRGVKFRLWLPGAWPSQLELLGGRKRLARGTTVVRHYAEQRHRWLTRAKEAVRAARPPVLKGDVYLGFWHRRPRYAEADRTAYSHALEALVVPPMVWSGAFRLEAIQGISHIFDVAAGRAVGVHVVLMQP
jgi:hypothetical protein